MKKQETVTKNYEKVQSQWREAHKRKLVNIETSIENIENKIFKLQQESRRLNAERERLLQQRAPEAPTVEERLSQFQSTSFFSRD